jgi:DNA-binding GntR family transcriptional regulator
VGTSDSPLIGPVRTESTPSLIAQRLRDAIASGHFQPGQQLLEVNLAKRFGVSRGILREGMQRLAQEGLVVRRPNYGVFVAEYDADEVFDIYTARLAIERAACLKVIDVTGGAAVLAADLDALTDQLEERRDQGASDDELAQLDIEFHEHMVAAARSPRLDRMHSTLATESRMCLSALENRAYPMQERIAEHRQIAAAIRDENVPALHDLLAMHMDHAVEMIVRVFEEKEKGTADPVRGAG